MNRRVLRGSPDHSDSKPGGCAGTGRLTRGGLMFTPIRDVPGGALRAQFVRPPRPRGFPGAANVHDERCAVRWPQEHGDVRMPTGLQPGSIELPAQAHQNSPRDCGDYDRAGADRPASRCAVSTCDPRAREHVSHAPSTKRPQAPGCRTRTTRRQASKCERPWGTSLTSRRRTACCATPE